MVEKCLNFQTNHCQKVFYVNFINSQLKKEYINVGHLLYSSCYFLCQYKRLTLQTIFIFIFYFFAQ